MYMCTYRVRTGICIFSSKICKLYPNPIFGSDLFVGIWGLSKHACPTFCRVPDQWPRLFVDYLLSPPYIYRTDQGSLLVWQYVNIWLYDWSDVTFTTATGKNTWLTIEAPWRKWKLGVGIWFLRWPTFTFTDVSFCLTHSQILQCW